MRLRGNIEVTPAELHKAARAADVIVEGMTLRGVDPPDYLTLVRLDPEGELHLKNRARLWPVELWGTGDADPVLDRAIEDRVTVRAPRRAEAPDAIAARLAASPIGNASDDPADFGYQS